MHGDTDLQKLIVKCALFCHGGVVANRAVDLCVSEVSGSLGAMHASWRLGSYALVMFFIDLFCRVGRRLVWFDGLD